MQAHGYQCVHRTVLERNKPASSGPDRTEPPGLETQGARAALDEERRVAA